MSTGRVGSVRVFFFFVPEPAGRFQSLFPYGSCRSVSLFLPGASRVRVFAGRVMARSVILQVGLGCCRAGSVNFPTFPTHPSYST